MIDMRNSKDVVFGGIRQDGYLDIQNINRSVGEIEYHPLVPFLPSNAKVLFLGSFPPQRKRWCIDFYYPNFINDHWRIEGELFYNDRNHFVDLNAKCFLIDDIIQHCSAHGIAFYDTATAVRRLKNNASDKFLEVVEPTDIHAIISHLPKLRAVVTTGERATETICRYYDVPNIPKVNAHIEIDSRVELYRLPSSSRAYPLAFSKKVEAYREMFKRYL